MFKAEKKKKEDKKMNVENMKTRDQQVQVKFAGMISFQVMPISFPPIALWAMRTVLVYNCYFLRMLYFK